MQKIQEWQPAESKRWRCLDESLKTMKIKLFDGDVKLTIMDMDSLI